VIVKRKIIKDKYLYERINSVYGLGVCSFCKYSINIIAACSLFNTTQISYCGLSIFMIIARKTKTEFKLSESKYAYRVSQD
jgi:hypothetical protein